MTKLQKRYIQMMLYVRIQEIKHALKQIDDKDESEETKHHLASLGGELQLIESILEEIVEVNKDDQDKCLDS